MLKDRTIGCIGAGNMARAIVSGLIHGDHISKDRLAVSDVKKSRLTLFQEEFGIFTTESNAEVVSRSDIIVLAVKPQVLDQVVAEITSAITSKKLVISIAAGVPIHALAKALPQQTAVVRVMPNITALVGEGVSGLAPGKNASEGDLKTASALFNAVGKTVVVEEEQLDAVTGLSGSGPAYIFLIVDALADAGVKVGLSRDDSLLLASQTVLGAAKLLMETGEHPAQLKDRVTSPGGTAIAGIHTLEEGGLRTTLINAVEAATERSQELGMKFHPED